MKLKIRQNIIFLNSISYNTKKQIFRNKFFIFCVIRQRYKLKKQKNFL